MLPLTKCRWIEIKVGAHCIMVELILCMFFFLMTLNDGVAEDNHPSLKGGLMAPGNFISLGENGSYAILVEKSTQTLYIYDCDYNIIKTLPVTTGQNSGDKTKIGDKKTPEGVYFFTNIIEEKNLFPEYGIMAFPMNYPNPVDLTRNKNGGGIWLHATNQSTQPLKPYDTKGCIVTHNEDILQIASHVKLERTPVVVVEQIEYGSIMKFNTERMKIVSFLGDWKDAWEKKDIGRYISAYSKGFRSRDMDLKEWKMYKMRLNKKYSYVKIKIKDMKILRYDDYVVVMFLQDFQSDGYGDLGIKRLYLTKGTDGWEIVGEEWKEIPTKNPKAIAMVYMQRMADKHVRADGIAIRKLNMEGF